MNNTTDVITIVSGLPRSGTSMMMKMLEAGGLEAMTDNVRKADVDNPKGYYEYEIVKKIASDASWVPDTRGKVFKMVATLLPHLPDGFRYQIVFMRRAMSEMLQSQGKMLERLGAAPPPVSDDKMAALFQKQLDRVIAWLDSRDNVRVLYVDYGKVMEDTEAETTRVAAFLEQDLDPVRMRQIVDPELYRNRV